MINQRDSANTKKSYYLFAIITFLSVLLNTLSPIFASTLFPTTPPITPPTTPPITAPITPPTITPTPSTIPTITPTSTPTPTPTNSPTPTPTTIPLIVNYTLTPSTVNINQQFAQAYSIKTTTGNQVLFSTIIPAGIVIPGYPACQNGQGCIYYNYFPNNPPGLYSFYLYGYPTTLGQYNFSTTFVEPATGFTQTINAILYVNEVSPTPTSTPTPTPTPPSAYKVFITSTEFNGNLNGLTGADSKCQALAKNAGLKGIYKAWLSTSTVDAKDRIPNVRYTLVNGSIIAKNKSDLLDGTIENKIKVDEKGNTAPLRYSFTGTYATGKKTGFNCGNWTTSSSLVKLGTVGYDNYTNSGWSSISTFKCNLNTIRLYCFQTGL